ncbi:ATP-binding cassette domain-containing protein [Streptomyces sp. TRM66268-LWL]|uniref:ATP-binding cassette domain-containing protein n=1 Tax=Streptomyces polyasparticus TaxID=2767826 RepID=A0ABR7SUT4_9ACTN|nr:ATP-binding cassette domain-containing protein [Streptomyces polyasparticus]MBC9718362.1 ATP-binding cassette domain-containing protein [Streptomyces polyasparticus]
MIQATGLTSNPKKDLPPTIDDVSFEARAGRVTALLGAVPAETTEVLRLMLQLKPGRGVTYFRGRPLNRIAHPSREVGILLGDVPGHPARTVRGQLRMLCAASGVPATRADEVLEVVGLVSLRDERLGTLSRGMDRRLGLACALLADPHTLVLNAPTEALSAREAAWLHAMLRAHAQQGGTVLFTTSDPKEAARTADRVITLEQGCVVADQDAAEFARTRLRPRVAIRSPHAARLFALLSKEARVARRSVEVVREEGNRLSVYGSSTADVGETAYKHGVLLHQLADELGDSGPPPPPQERPSTDAHPTPAKAALAHPTPSNAAPIYLAPAHPAHGSSAHPAPAHSTHEPSAHETPTHPTPPPSPPAPTPPTATPAEAKAALETAKAEAATAPSHNEDQKQSEADSKPDRTEKENVNSGPQPVTSGLPLHPLPPPITVHPARSPLRPLRYELRRAAGIPTGYLTVAFVLAVSALLSVILARSGHTPLPRLLAAWPYDLPLPPAALGAGLLGALSFGDEFKHPALAADRGTVPRRLGLLLAKLVVCAATALLIAALVLVCDAALLHVVYGEEVTRLPSDWPSLTASWLCLVTGCSWAGLLAAGVFRSTAAGLAALLAVPVVLVPVVQKALEGPAVRTAAGLPARLRDLALVQWPIGTERYVAGAVRMLAQPIAFTLALSLVALMAAYLLTSMRSRVR